MLLYLGVAAMVAASFLLVFALRHQQDEETGVSGSLRSIERDYAGKAVVAAGDSVQADRPIMVQFRALALRLSPRGVVDKLQHRLDTAGNPGAWTPERLLSFKGVGLAAGVALAFLLAARNPGYLPLMAAAFAGAGFFLPDVLLYNTGLKRQESIGKTLPDILDLLVVSVEAGLGFDAALARVGKNTKGALSGELIRVMQEIQIGKSREEALRSLSARSSVTELRTFVGALIQAAELGIPIGNVLREQAKEMRVKRRQKAEERAQKLAVKITVPVVFCIFPALFVIVLGPAAIGYLDPSSLR